MTDTDVAIVGAGFAGLGTAIRLDAVGRSDFRILEAGPSVGGTWRDNRYPGAACDVPGRLYSLSFAQTDRWTSRYPKQAEIQAYLEDLVPRFGLADRLSLNTAVDEAHWAGDHWRLELSDGSTLTARVVVYGVGGLRIPRFPSIPGRERFAGISMHSARWQDVDLKGLRVGVVGTGASAVQIVPAIVDQVGSLTVFQRTPPWVRPRNDRPYGRIERRVVAGVPGLRQALRMRRYLLHERWYPIVFGPGHRIGRALGPLLRRDIRRQVDDPALAERLMPPFQLGCKRVLSVDGWYEALQQPHVTLESRPITAVTPTGIHAGQHHELDVIVWATGFEVGALGRIRVFGEDGRSLRQVWGDRPFALHGIQVPGFPNAFMMLGPNTALGHNSVLIMVEAQIRYLLSALELIDDRGAIDATEAATKAWVERCDRRHRKRVWASGCDSWYLTGERENFSLYPGSTVRYVLETRKVRASEQRFA